MTQRLVLRYAARSDVGLVRKDNEDSGYAGGHMLIVADGMGGHAAGELASATVIATFAELDRQPPGDEVLAAMADAVETAHEELSRVVSATPDSAGMGTTITALSWEGDRVALAHVGDSRAYLLRDGQLNQLTRDHTYVQTLVDSGQITPAQAAAHDKRNLLMKAVDGIHTVEADLSMREVRAGDRFLLCTDGLTGVVSDQQIRDLLSRGDPTGAVIALVDRALEAGAPDNVTCVVADLVAEDPGREVRAAASSAPEPSGATPRPAVVGAAAEPRNRHRLPGINFPDDSQPDPDHMFPAAAASTIPAAGAAQAAGPATEDQPSGPRAPLRPQRRWRRIVLAGAAALVVVLAALFGAFYAWTQSQYYVGADNGKIALFRGISQGPGSHGFSRAVQISATDVTALPAYEQEKVSEAIPVSDEAGGRKVVADLEARAARCQIRPIPEGCPNKPPPATSATPTATIATQDGPQ